MINILSNICKIGILSLLLMAAVSFCFGYRTVEEKICSQIVSRVQTADKYGQPKYFVNTVQETVPVSPSSYEESKNMTEYCFTKTKVVSKRNWASFDFPYGWLLMAFLLVLELVISIFFQVSAPENIK